MTVVALCETFDKVSSLRCAINGIGRIRLVFCVTNNDQTSSFTSRLIHSFLRQSSGEKLRIIKWIVWGRLKILPFPLHNPRSIRCIKSFSPDIGLHATSVIYRQELFDYFSVGVLNAHIGFLPSYRGRSVMEWSIFFGDRTAITTFLWTLPLIRGKELFCE